MKHVQFSVCAALISILCTSCGSLPIDPEHSFDRQAWLNDYQELKKAVALNYVNLDDEIRAHSVDPLKLDDETTGRLKNVYTNDEAQHTLFTFVGAFHDPYLSLMSDQLIARERRGTQVQPHMRHQLAPGETAAPPDKNWGGSSGGAVEGFSGQQAQLSPEAVSILPNIYAEQACTSMGFKKRNFEFHFPYQTNSRRREREFQSNSFPSVVLALDDGRRVGIIRLGRFTPKSFWDACLHEWPAYSKLLRKKLPAQKPGGRLPKKGMVVNGTCGPECQDVFTTEYVENRLIKEFDETITRLTRDHVDGIVIDVSDNNGGTSWETALPVMITEKPVVCGDVGLTKNPATAENMKGQRAMLQERIDRLKGQKQTATTGVRITAIQTQIGEIDRLSEQMNLSCDRSLIWEKPDIATQCPLTIKQKISSCDIDPIYKVRPHIYRGPLFILVNRNSAGVSASFAARMKDSHAAMILGETTVGTGCLTHHKGIVTQLPNSGLRLYAPDCARYMSDGRNEVEGVQPDIELNMEEMPTPRFLPHFKATLQAELQKMSPAQLRKGKKVPDQTKPADWETPEQERPDTHGFGKRPWDQVSPKGVAPQEQDQTDEPVPEAKKPVDTAPPTTLAPVEGAPVDAVPSPAPTGAAPGGTGK